jgi:hypothetical protein
MKTAVTGLAAKRFLSHMGYKRHVAADLMSTSQSAGELGFWLQDVELLHGYLLHWSRLPMDTASLSAWPFKPLR